MTFIMQSNWSLQETKNKLIKQEQRREEQERESEREKRRKKWAAINSWLQFAGLQKGDKPVGFIKFFGKLFLHLLLRK